MQAQNVSDFYTGSPFEKNESERFAYANTPIRSLHADTPTRFSYRPHVSPAADTFLLPPVT